MRPLLAQVRLELALTFRNGESLLLTLGIPVAVLVFFSVVDVLPIDGDAVDFLAPACWRWRCWPRRSPTSPSAPGSTARTASSSGWRYPARPPPASWRPRGSPSSRAIAVQAVALVATGLALGWRPDVEPVPLVAATVLAVAAFVGSALVLAGGGSGR